MGALREITDSSSERAGKPDGLPKPHENREEKRHVGDAWGVYAHTSTRRRADRSLGRNNEEPVAPHEYRITEAIFPGSTRH